METELMACLAEAKAAHFDAAGRACDYGALQGSRERARIAACLAELESFDLRRIAIPAQTAFWLNLFNATVLRDAAELAPARGVRDVERFFERPRLTLAGLRYSLDDIQHGVLRGNMPKFGSRRAPMRRDDPRLAHMPFTFDERIHFALHSAARSSPANNAFKAGRLDDELEDATEQYLRYSVQVENDGALVVLPRQFYWYEADFGDAQNALAFAVSRLDDEIVDSVDRRRGRVKVRYAEFDWRLNSRG